MECCAATQPAECHRKPALSCTMKHLEINCPETEGMWTCPKMKKAVDGPRLMGKHRRIYFRRISAALAWPCRPSP